MTPPRVRFAIGAYPPSIGGAQVHTRQLVQSLAETGLALPEVVTLWRTNRNDWVRASTVDLSRSAGSEEDEGVEVHTAGLDGPLTAVDRVLAKSYLLTRTQSAKHWARRLALPPDHSDVAHVVRLGREHLAVAAFEEALRRKRPKVLTANHHERWSGRRPDPVWRRLYRLADAVVALTHVEAEMLHALGVSADRVVVTGIGPVLADAKETESGEAPARGASRPYLLFLGQQLRYKRVDLAIQATVELGRRGHDVELVLAGPASPDTADTVRRLGADDRVRILGVVDVRTKTRLLRDAACLVHPSSQESFGGVLVEAATTGTPFVCSDIPQLREVTKTLEWGSAIPMTADALADELERVFATPPTPSQRAAATARATSLYSWERLAQRYADLYDELSSRGRR